MTPGLDGALGSVEVELAPWAKSAPYGSRTALTTYSIPIEAREE
jgi:hypothetical protein